MFHSWVENAPSPDIRHFTGVALHYVETVSQLIDHRSSTTQLALEFVHIGEGTVPSGLMEEMQAVMKDFEESLPTLQWNKFTEDHDAEAMQFVGKGKEWTVTVLTHLDLGGNKRFDGSAAKPNTLIHLPSELAERVFHLAKEYTHGTTGS